LDTTPLANGNHDISVVVDDCVNTNRADVQVNIDNSTDGGTVNGGDDFVDEFGCTNFTTNLSARLISPADSANLSGQANLTVEARATGGQSISRVIYLVDLDLAAESSTAPYNSSLNTTYYTDGAHIITAIAMGENGNCSDYTDENSRSNVLFSNYLGSDDNARPYITNVSIEPTRDTLRIAWQTTMVTNALVEYGTTLSLGARVDSSQQNNDHEITLTGLQPNQLYYLKLSGRTTTGVAAEDYYTSASTNTNINVGDNHGCDQAAVNAYYACYYNNSDLTDMRFAQNENGINYSWSAGQSPDSRISPDTFSIIWQGQFFFDGGEYEFEATVDDGVRIYIDGNRIIDEWRNQNASTFRSISDISRGDHIVTMEYFQDTGTGEANLNWIYLGQNGDNPDSPTTPTSTCDVATNPNCDPNGEYNLMTINDINAFPTDISVDFSFRVSESANSTIYYGTSRSNLVSTINIGFSTDPDAVYRREARGLQPDTTYYYRIESTSNANAQRQAESPILSFTTHYAPNRQDMTASVSWDSTCEGVGRVYFDRFPHTSLAAYASSPYGGVVTAGRSGNRYTAVIVGLSSGVTYHYRHEIEGCAGSITPALNQADKTFTTPVN